MFWSIDNGKYVGQGHVALAYYSGSSLQIHDSEVHRGAINAYSSLNEVASWFASVGTQLTYLGWPIGCDGVILIQDTATANINKASLDGFRYSNGKVYASGWHIANYKYEYVIFIDADTGKEFKRVKASAVTRADVRKTYNVDGAEK